MIGETSMCSRRQEVCATDTPLWKASLLVFGLALLLVTSTVAVAQSSAGSSPQATVAEGKNIPVTWDCERGENILWSAHLGSFTLGTPAVNGGKIYVGTNNGAGYLKRYPAKVDLGVLLCFDAATGEFLWQHSNEKLPEGRVTDWPNIGLASTPFVEGNRLWYVSNRCEVVCLDTEGFRDGENDGPFQTERPLKGNVVWEEAHEADVVWKLDMKGTLGVLPHNWSTCTVTASGRRLFVVTSNGVGPEYEDVPNPQAPSFLCLDKNTGDLLWSDNSPGKNTLNGQWGSPAFGVFEGQPQVLFPGGDGWLYSFDPAGEKGRSKLLWKVDLNPKDSERRLQRCTRNAAVTPPTIYQGRVFIAVGDEPEHGDGLGHVWCINPVNRGGDVSASLVFNRRDPQTPIAPRRLKGMDKLDGDFERPNPNSAIVWHYAGRDPGGKEFTDQMHRSASRLAIKDDLLIAPDSAGCVHCLDALTGKCHWTFDVLVSIWSAPLIVDSKVYVPDEDGDVHIFALSKTLTEIRGRTDSTSEPTVQSMPNSCWTAPVVAHDILYIASSKALFAMKQGAKSVPLKPREFRASDVD